VSALKKVSDGKQDGEKPSLGEKKDVALPSYLRDFTGDEEEVNKKHEDTRAKKYAVDMFLTANPNIGKCALPGRGGEQLKG